MARQSNSPRLGEAQEFFLNLYPDVAWDLQVYCDVVGAQKTKIINRAARELIDRDLAENRGFRDRFEALSAQRIDDAKSPKTANGRFRVIKGAEPSRAGRRKKPDR